MRKHSLTSRLLSLALCLCMVLGMLPGVALAEESNNVAALIINGTTTYEYATLSEAVEAAEDCTEDENAVLKLLDDIQLDDEGQYIERGVMTLDLNGFEINCTVYGEAPICLYGDTVVTIIDSGEGGTLRGVYAGLMVANSGTAIVNSGNIVSEYMAVYCYHEYSSTIVNGGTLDGEYYAAVASSDATVTISGGSINGELTRSVNSDGTVYGTIKLTLGKDGGSGALFPNGVSVYGATIGDLIGTGIGFGRDGELVAFDPAGTEIEGEVTVVADHAHDMQTVVTEPTCTEKGTTVYGCSICDYRASVEEVPPLGHALGDDGLCTVCGEAPEVTVIMEDTYGDGWNGNAIAIYASGELVGTATIEDGKEGIFSVPYDMDKFYTFVWVNTDNGNNYSYENSFSLVVNGLTVYSKEDCDSLSYDKVFYTFCDHERDGGVEKDPTCTEKGGLYNTCTKCGDAVIENEIPALGHTLDGDGVCSVCGFYSMEITVNMTDSYGDGWNGNGITIFCGDEPVAYLTIEGDEATGTWSDELDATKEYTFRWNSGSYAEEASFEVLINGEKVFVKEDCDEYGNSDVLFSIVDGEVVDDDSNELGQGGNDDDDDDDDGDAYVYVGGVMLEAGDYLDLVGEVSDEKPNGGYAYFDGITLTLNNYTYSGSGYAYGEGEVSVGILLGTDMDELKLNLQGTNTLTNPDPESPCYGILMGLDMTPFNLGTLTVYGSGTLNLAGEYMMGMWANGLTIHSGTVNIASIIGIFTSISESALTVNGGELNVAVNSGGEASHAIVMGQVTLNAGKITAYCDTFPAIKTDKLTVNGGCLEVKKGGIEAYSSDGSVPFVLGDGVSVTSPEDAVVGSYTNEYGVQFYTFYDSEGNQAESFVIEGPDSENSCAEHADENSDRFCDNCDAVYVGYMAPGASSFTPMWGTAFTDLVISVPEFEYHGYYMIADLNQQEYVVGGFVGEDNTITVPGEHMNGHLVVAVVQDVYFGKVDFKGGSLMDEAAEEIEIMGMTITDTYHEIIAGIGSGLYMGSEMYTRPGYTLVGYLYNGVEYDVEEDIPIATDDFVIELVWEALPSFEVEVFNDYGTADTVTLSNPNATLGVDYVTTVSSTIGTAVDVWGVRVGGTLHGNGVFEYDEKTCTLTVFGEYVEEDLQIEVVPCVTFTTHMNGGAVREKWQESFEPDANGALTNMWACGDEMGFFCEWNDEINDYVWDGNLVFVRQGYKLVGYNTAADGSGTAYALDEMLSPTEDIEVYLMWERVIPDCEEHADSDANDRCDNCGKVLANAVLNWNSISLKGNIAIKYYMTLSDDVLADETAYMQFTMADGEIITVPVSKAEPIELNGLTYFVFSCAVSAKEMADVVKSQFFYAGGSTEEYTYSVKAYADYILETSDNEALVELVEKMLHYGSASQIHFGYNTDNLANAGLDSVDYSDVTVNASANADQDSELVNFYAASLILKSETTLRFFFQAEGAFSVTYDGKTLAVEERNGLCYVDVTGISAKDLDEAITITVNDGNGEFKVSFNPMAYCAAVLNDTTGAFDAEMKDLAAALYLYNQAAKAYLEGVYV